jgi:uncharacterized protein YjaZ
MARQELKRMKNQEPKKKNENHEFLDILHTTQKVIQILNVLKESKIAQTCNKNQRSFFKFLSKVSHPSIELTIIDAITN